MLLLHEIDVNSSKNLMNASNLTIVWSPNFVRGNNPMDDVKMCALDGGGGIGTMVKLMIEKHQEIFS